jgi:hypothetical protein
VLILIVIIIKTVKRFTTYLRQDSRFKKMIDIILQELEWNFIIGLLMQTSSELTTSALINIVHVSFSDINSTIGFSISILVIVITI